jgi:hypothetical protein
MSMTGIGSVFDKEEFVATVDYSIHSIPGTNTHAGTLKNISKRPTPWKAEVLTLHTIDKEKLDFSVSSINTKGYQIISIGGFYI